MFSFYTSKSSFSHLLKVEMGDTNGFITICPEVMYDNFIKSACLKFLSSPRKTGFPFRVVYHLIIIGTGVMPRILMRTACPPGVCFLNK